MPSKFLLEMVYSNLIEKWLCWVGNSRVNRQIESYNYHKQSSFFAFSKKNPWKNATCHQLGEDCLAVFVSGIL